ncbi:MAG: 50S ribosomal protein L24 [Patescibacteria group bacterium]
MYIKKGDTVKIISGRDRGKTGAVIDVSLKESRISVEGVNIYKKRSRPKRQGQKGETVEVVRPFPASKAMLMCKNCKLPSRVGMRVEGSQKVRYCKRCESTI